MAWRDPNHCYSSIGAPSNICGKSKRGDYEISECFQGPKSEDMHRDH